METWPLSFSSYIPRQIQTVLWNNLKLGGILMLTVIGITMLVLGVALIFKDKN